MPFAVPVADALTPEIGHIPSLDRSRNDSRDFSRKRRGRHLQQLTSPREAKTVASDSATGGSPTKPTNSKIGAEEGETYGVLPKMKYRSAKAIYSGSARLNEDQESANARNIVDISDQRRAGVLPIPHRNKEVFVSFDFVSDEAEDDAKDDEDWDSGRRRWRLGRR